MLIFYLLFLVSSSVLSDDESSTSSSSSISPNPVSCGTPNATEEIVELSTSPNQSFVFNAPFDMNFMDSFRINHYSWIRVAWKIEIEKNERSRIFVSKSSGILEDEDLGVKVPIGFRPFDYDEKNFVNDKMNISWVNIPPDASPESKEECFDEWFSVIPKFKILKIEYNS